MFLPFFMPKNLNERQDMKKIILLFATAAISIAGQAYWVGDDNEEHYTNIIPMSYLRKEGSLIYGHTCGEFNDDKSRKIKTIIWQENPCFSWTLTDDDNPEDYEYKKIDDNTVEVYNELSFKGDDMVLIDCKYTNKHKKIAECEDKVKEIMILGQKGCKESGKEIWTTYYYDSGKWNFACKTTFMLK